MARYKLILAYDGTDFLGYQRSGRSRTVQGEVEKALRQLGWQGEKSLSAGRTDTGVHASGQVVAFDLDWNHDPEDLGRALNANLPLDVAVREIGLAEDDFHPRYGALRRTYQYALYSQPNRDPLRERFAWRIWPKADLDQLQAAAQLLIGTYDFAAFGNPPRVGGSTVRTVFAASWNPQAGCLLFEITANAFLYHMVRRLVYLQVQVGQSRLTLQELARAVQMAERQTPGLAPPNGLVLTEVVYPVKGDEERNH